MKKNLQIDNDCNMTTQNNNNQNSNKYSLGVRLETDAPNLQNKLQS